MTERLFARLGEEDVAAVASGWTRQQALAVGAPAATTARSSRCVFGVWHAVPAVLEKTGLRADQPPEDVHAMARGPLAAGGALYYADLVAEALGRAGGATSARCAAGWTSAARRAASSARSRRPGPRPSGTAATRTRGAIAWAREHLPGDRLRPLARASRRCPTTTARFDLAFAISIWSHFGEQAALRVAGRDASRARARRAAACSTAHGMQSVASLRAQAGGARRASSSRSAPRSTGRGFWFARRVRRRRRLGRQAPEWGTRS